MVKSVGPYMAIAKAGDATFMLYSPDPESGYEEYEAILIRDVGEVKPAEETSIYMLVDSEGAIKSFKKDIKVFNDKYNLCLEFINICDNCGSDEYAQEYYEDGMCDDCAMRCRGCEGVIELVDLPDPDSDLCNECDDLHSGGL